MEVTPYKIAERFIGVEEIPGKTDNPTVLSWLRLDSTWPEHDEVPWCSAFMNFVFWLLRLPRSKKLNARSWLEVGQPVSLAEAQIGHDVVVLWRGSIAGEAGHVGLYSGQRRSGLTKKRVAILGGNQSDSVCVQEFDEERILGIRRIA